MDTGEPEGRSARRVGGLELDEHRHQRLHREWPGRATERQGTRLRSREAADVCI